MSSQAFHFIFTGFLWPGPSRSHVTINVSDPVTMNVLQLNLELRATIKIVNSQVMVEVVSNSADVRTLGNLTQLLVQGVVDAFMYMRGEAYGVQLTAVYSEDGEGLSSTSFVAGVMPASSILTDSAEAFDTSDLFRLMSQPIESPQLDYETVLRGNQIRFALSDIREAIFYSEYTGLFCFRAIESIRQCFSDFDESGEEINNSSSWKRMGIALRIEKSFTENVRRDSIRQRHGANVFMTEEARIDAVKRTRMVIDRFIVLLKSGNEELPEHVETLTADTDIGTS